MSTKDYQSKQSQIIPFSLSQLQHQPQCSTSTHIIHHNSITKNKLGFILNLIHKYQSQPEINYQYPILSQALAQDKHNHDQNKFLSQFCSHSQNLSFFLNENKQDQYEDLLISPLKESDQLSESIIYKKNDEDSKVSQFKSQLQQTHQKILHKYLTPIRDTQPNSNSINTTNSNKIELQNTICEFLNSQKEKKENDLTNQQGKKENNSSYKDEMTCNNDNQIQQNQKLNDEQFEVDNNTNSQDKNKNENNPQQQVNEVNVPLVESIIMVDIKDQLCQYSSYFTKQVLNNMTQEIINKDQQQQTDQLKLTHIFAFCVIILLLLLWKM